MEINNIKIDKSLSEESIKLRTELFNKYILPHRNLIYRICIQFTYSQTDIEDNYSGALENFYRYMDSYDPTRSLKTWIYAVTRRFVTDMNIRRNGRVKHDNNVDVQSIASVLTTDEEQGENCMGMDNYHEHYNDDILEALAELKPIHREALLLQQSGYKLSEIVEITYRNGTLKTRNIETVKSRIFLAKQQLKSLINRDGEKRND